MKSSALKKYVDYRCAIVDILLEILTLILVSTCSMMQIDMKHCGDYSYQTKTTEVCRMLRET